MNDILAITKKELRAYFLSPIALIFLGTFLFVTLFTFFWVEQFFARNIADVRPLFSWLPVLLIFLCSALTMRLWSEEQKTGTLEVLLTLPVRISDLVLGKFLASLILVAVALFLTLGLPITVSMLGDLDWGPVVGGYLAAILVAGAYIAIGLWVSSMTENQIISLIASVILCGAFYLLGSDVIAQAFGNRGAEIMADLGTGSRFESIRRGVLDLRDLIYYAGLIATFLTLNVLSLRAKGFSEGQRTAANRQNAYLGAALVIGNVLLLNLNLSDVAIRADLTERGEYSVSRTTKDILRGLQEPLLIRGYFSAKTHPLLAPTVPQIRDLIEEYGVIGGGNVRTEYVDPREDEGLEKEAAQLYGIKSFPFRIADRRDQAVVNSYFSILVKYGDQHEVLNFNDLIEITGTTPENIEVRLRNLEYDLTRTVKKVAYGFQTVDALFADLEEPAELMAFVTEASLPGNFTDAPKTIEAVGKKLADESGGKFAYEIIDPDSAGAKETRQTLQTKYGLRPYALSLLSQETFFLHLVLKIGDRYELVAPAADEYTEAELEEAILASIKRGAPGFLKTIGLSKPKPEQPNPQLPPQFQQPPRDNYRAIAQQLSQTYEVKDVDLTKGRVDTDIDVLVVVAPADFDEQQRFAVDQFLMRGGTVIVYAGAYELNPGMGGSIAVKQVNSGLDDLLGAYGITVESSMVMDLQNEGIPVPVERNLGGFTVREFQTVSYPFFINVRADGLDADSPVVAGLPSLAMAFSSPVTAVQPSQPASEGDGESEAETDEADAVTIVELVRSSPDSWTTTNTNVQPDFAAYPDAGFATGEERSSKTLAVLVTGSLPSAFAERNSPVSGETVIKQSPSTTRLAVFGSTSMVNDMVLQMSREAATNLELAQNLVDWGVEDTDLLGIRARSTFARTLVPMTNAERAQYEYINYGIAFLALVIIVILTISRRRQLQPLELDERKVTTPSAGKTAEAHS